MVFASEVQPLVAAFFLVNSEADLRSREVKIDFCVRVWLEDDPASRQDFGLLEIQVFETSDDTSDFIAAAPKVCVGQNPPRKSPTFSNAVFEVGEEAHLKIGINTETVVGFCLEASVPEDVEQARRQVTPGVTRSVDKMNAGAEVDFESLLVAVQVKFPRRSVTRQTEEADPVGAVSQHPVH